MRQITAAMVLLLGLAWSGAAMADGAAVWGSKCKSCHGANGQGNPGLANAMGGADKLNLAKAATKSQGDGALIATVKSGRGKMPSYAGKLSDAEVSEVVKYLKSL